jgi:hypothetical protein
LFDLADTGFLCARATILACSRFAARVLTFQRFKVLMFPHPPKASPVRAQDFNGLPSPSHSAVLCQDIVSTAGA